MKPYYVVIINITTIIIIINYYYPIAGILGSLPYSMT